MGTVALQFSTGRSCGSTIIRRLSHSPFSHVDFVLADGTLLGAAIPGGVAIRPPDYHSFGCRRHMILETERADDILAIAHTQIGKRYDLATLWDFMGDEFPGQRDWRLDDCWFCSELAAWALETGGFWGPTQLAWPKNRVSPSDLMLVCLTDPRWINRETFWNERQSGAG